MGHLTFVDSLIEKKLMDLHCGYIGRVISTDGETATVQPLSLIKEKGKNAKQQAVISDVPVACKYKFEPKTITYVKKHEMTEDGKTKEYETETITVAVPTLIAKGDLVACLCADRDITSARQGRNEKPPAGHHSISDSIIVGIL